MPMFQPDDRSDTHGQPHPIIPTALILALFAVCLFKFLTDPLRHVPGPLVARITPLWLWKLSWSGVECRTILALHHRYGPVVRIAPNQVDIADGVVINQIYHKNGGLLQSPQYTNFDVDGFSTIFSDLDPTHRAIRAKAVAPLFAQPAIARGNSALQNIATAIAAELERRRARAEGKLVDVLNLFRAWAMDTATLYLFGQSFNGVGPDRLAATAFIDKFVAGGRFFHLPGLLYDFYDSWAARFDKNQAQVTTSDSIVKAFAAKVVDKSIAEENDTATTYQGRLLSAGVTREEAIAQVVDVMFAGTDAHGRIMSAICYHLKQSPEKYKRIRQEVLDNPNIDVQSLPYFSGTIKEGLRLSMANPIRLLRIVSLDGLQILGWPKLPTGTNVGLGAYTLHLNPGVFPSPHEFMPERWTDPTPEMLRDSFYFGAGTRQCIARNLAMTSLMRATEALIRNDVLRGAKPVKEDAEIKEWFNAQVSDGVIELQW